MKIQKLTRAALVAAPLLIVFLSGCGDFWQAPTGTGSTGTGSSFTLSNSGNISMAPGASSGNTATITVTPSNSFTGTVSLTCTITSAPASATNPASCSVAPTSVSITGTTAQTATLTAASSSNTTAGAYGISVTGTSGSTTQTTALCAEVSSSSSTCSAAAAASGVFYVLDQTTDQIVALSVSSGKLNTIGAVTLATTTPLAIAVAPNGQFLYVSTAYGIYLYTIGSNGAVTLGNGGISISPDQAYSMQVDATNSWLIEAVSGLAQLNGIAINSNTGLLATAGESEQHIALPVSTVTQLAISPTDSSSCGNCYVFVGMGSGGTELVNFNPGSANPFGATGTIQLKNSAGGSNAVAVDPTNRLLYVGESDALPSATQSGGLRAFTIATNGVTELAGSPYQAGGTGPSSVLPSADGNYVFVANRSVSGSSTGNVASFSVSTSALTSVGSIAAGPAGLLALAEDSTKSYLLVTDFAGGPDLTAYSMSSGALTSPITGSTGTDPVGAVAIAAVP